MTRVLRSILRPIALFLSLFRVFGRAAPSSVAILMYHRVTGDVGLELDLPYEHFCKQMAILAATGRVISLDDALRHGGQAWQDGEKRYVLTFDDAYEDFYTHAWPILKKHGLPATLYVPTGFVEGTHMPVAGDVGEKELLKPVTWGMLKEMGECELLTIGGHTHTHAEMPSLTDDEIISDLEQCDELLEENLGVTARHFAYPRGIRNSRVKHLVTSRYSSVVLAGGGVSRNGCNQPMHLSRIPIQRSDGMRWFWHRINGKLAFEEWALGRAKQIVYKLKGY